MGRIVELAEDLRVGGSKTWRMLVVVGMCRSGEVGVALEVWAEAKKGERGGREARELLVDRLKGMGKGEEEVRRLLSGKGVKRIGGEGKKKGIEGVSGSVEGEVIA